MIAPEIASELDRVLESSSKRLLAITEESAAKRPSPELWRKKEILGHLIDSALNNHQRFVLRQSALVLAPLRACSRTESPLQATRSGSTL
jgi:hypothetical protein